MEKDKVRRGRQCPSYSLEESIGHVRQIRDAIGTGPLDRQSLAEALGHASAKSGTLGIKLGTLVHYGLLQTLGEGAYGLTDLAVKILVPTNEDEMHEAIREAATNPDLFRDLLEAYREEGLPDMLRNILIRKYGVHMGKADAVAQNFRETMEFAGYLNENRLCAEPDSQEGPLGVTPRSGAHGGSPTPPPNAPRVAYRQLWRDESDSVEWQILLANKRNALLRMPADFTPADLVRVKAWLDFNKEVLVGSPAPTEDRNGSAEL